MNCIIVDDDKLSQNAMEHLVKQFPYLSLIGIYSSAVEALETINSGSVDLMFLDIEMPQMTGLEFVKNIPKSPMTILATSKKDYALEAFEYNIIDYLVKPVPLERFFKAITKAKNIYDIAKTDRHRTKDHLFIKVNGSIAKVDVKDILWIEALGDYITIHTPEKRYTVHSTLKAIEAKLDPEKFLRVHRSYIISIETINAIDDSVVAINKQLIPIGAVYKENFKKRLNLL